MLIRPIGGGPLVGTPEHIGTKDRAIERLSETLKGLIADYESWKGYNDDGFESGRIAEAKALLTAIEAEDFDAEFR